MSLNFNVRTGSPYMLPNYMTNTTTWHVFNALSGATLDLPSEAIYLNPQVPARQQRLELPLFFPDFWLWLCYDKRTKTATLTVRKVLRAGLKLTTLRRLAADGSHSEQPLPQAFHIDQGKTLTIRL